MFLGFGLKQFRALQKGRVEFLQMVGPRGLGSAEMAVSLTHEPAPATPAFEHSSSRSLLKKISSNTMGFVSGAMARVSTPSADAHPLHAFLTFVSVPLKHLIASVLDNPSKPIFPDPALKLSSSQLVSSPPTPAVAAQSSS